VTDLRAGTRLKVLAGLVAMMFAALTTRLWFLQVLAYEQKRQEAQNNAVRLVDVPARRGQILDTHGRVLVGNRASLVVTMNREEAGGQKEEILFRLSQLLDIPADVLGERLDDPRYYVFNPIPIAIDVPRRVVFYLKEHAREFPGVDVVEQPIRTFPEGSIAAHVLGYLGQISQDKLDDPAFAGYEPGDIVGVSGIESVYEPELSGTDGVVKYRVNSTGRNLGPIGELDPVPGDDIELTLDLRVQRLAEEPSSPEHEQQGQPRDRRRQDDRQVDHRLQQHLAAEPPPGQDQRERRPEDHHQQQGDRGRHDREDERIRHDRETRRPHQGAIEDRSRDEDEDRQAQQEAGDQGQRLRGPAGDGPVTGRPPGCFLRACVHGYGPFAQGTGMKPNDDRIAPPSGPASQLRNARASSGCRDALTTTPPRVTGTLASAGTGIATTRSEAFPSVT